MNHLWQETQGVPSDDTKSRVAEAIRKAEGK